MEADTSGRPSDDVLMAKHSDRIYLTGYRGTGKTTVGKLISTELSTQCVDLDQAIEAAAGKTIREIFEEGGEALFRDWETRCLHRSGGEGSVARVVSLGGGAILRKENRDFMRQTGVCIWLTARADTLAARIAEDETTGHRRPALTGLSPADEIQVLLAKREPLYREAADLILATDDKLPQELAAQVVAWLQDQSGSRI